MTKQEVKLNFFYWRLEITSRSVGLNRVSQASHSFWKNQKMSQRRCTSGSVGLDRVSQASHFLFVFFGKAQTCHRRPTCISSRTISHNGGSASNKPLLSKMSRNRGDF